MEAMEVVNDGGDAVVTAVLDRKINPLALEVKFGGRIGEFESQPNSEGDSCVLENLSPWNRALSKIGYALDEYETGKLLLRPMKTFLHVHGDEEFVELGFYLFYRLLKYHSCVKSLEIGDHLSFIQYASLINAALSACSSLESLKAVVVMEDPKNGEPLVRGIASLTTLQHLTLKGFVLSSKSNKMLVEMIKATDGLKTLRLDSVETALEDILTDAASGLQDLTELAITKKGLNRKSAQAIANLLSTSQTITKLDLSYHWDVDDQIFKIICEALASNQSLRVVIFNETRISDNGYVYMASALKQNTSIREVHCDTNDVGDDGIKAIADMIKSNETLQILNWQLSFMEMEEDAARAMAEAVAVNSTLLELNFYSIYVDFQESKLIIEALSRNTTLKQLGFTNCSEMEKHEWEALALQIKELNLFGRIQMNESVEEIRALASVMPTSDTIQKVIVTWKACSNGEEVKALFEAMCKNTSVLELKVECDNVPKIATLSLAELLRTTKTLKKAEIPLTIYEPSDFDLVMDALATNESITELTLHCEMLDSRAEESLGKMLKRNRNIHTLIMNDASTEYSIGTAPPHMVLADYLESNWTLLNLTNSHAWIPQDGLFRIEEVLRRNRRLLRRACSFALIPIADKNFASDFQVLARTDSLVENLAKVTGKTPTEAKEIVAKAQNFVRHNFPHF